MNKTILLAALVASTSLLALPTLAQDATAGVGANTAASVDTGSLAKGAAQTAGQATGAVGDSLHETGETARGASRMLHSHAQKTMKKAAATGDAAADTHAAAGMRGGANAVGAGAKLGVKADAQAGGNAGH
jgi:hypothetical protein